MKASSVGQLAIASLVAAGIGAAALVPPAGAAQRDELGARVRLIEDHIEIERLLLEYGKALDNRDFAAYARLFAADGEWSGSTGTFRGPAAIQAAMERAFTPTPGAGTPPANYHLLTNAMIDVSGDQATANSKWTFVRVVDNKPVIANAGSYEDRLVREKGRWRFRSRLAPSVLSPGPG